MNFKLSIIYLFIFSFTSKAETFYLDPVNGDLNNSGTIYDPWSTLEEVINGGYIISNEYTPLPYDPKGSNLISKNTSGYVNAGDTLMLLDGLHGNVFLTNYINTIPIAIIGISGGLPIIESVHLRACKNWRFENVTISTEPYGYYLNNRLFYIESHNFQGPSSNIELLRCEIYSTENPWDTANEWIDQASRGVYISGDSITVTDNIIRNVSFGIDAVGNFINAVNNQIVNFSGDGMRMLGSNNSFEYNLIKNCYDVDENHDDGIQSWAQINGVVSDDNKLIGNIIINSDNPDRPLNGPLQGIGCFDGMYHRWKVTNNLIIVNHWHGITFSGAIDCEVINNTVLDLTPDISPGGSWIRIGAHKDGTPSSGCIVANNVANSFHVDADTYSNIVMDTYEQYENNFIDYINLDFHLKPSSILIDSANPNYSPVIDIEKNDRPVGDFPDIGAYEYSKLTTNENVDNHAIQFFPNPVTDHLFMDGIDKNYTVQIRNSLGHLVLTKTLISTNGLGFLDLSELNNGLYFISIIGSLSGVKNFHSVQKIYKN